MADWQLSLLELLPQLSTDHIKCHLGTKFDQKSPFLSERAFFKVSPRKLEPLVREGHRGCFVTAGGCGVTLPD